MPEDFIRQSIRFTPHTTNILRGRASEMWPEFEGNVNGLTNKVIADWDRIRDKNGGGGRMTQLIAIREELAALTARVEALEGGPHDTDHG
jgi:hypothetical protein